MEVRGLKEFLEGESQETGVRVGDMIEKAKKEGLSLSTITKALILTFLELDYKKYCELKEKFFNEVIKPIEDNNTKNYNKEQLDRIKKMHELDIEILNAKLEVVNKKMEDLK